MPDPLCLEELGGSLLELFDFRKVCLNAFDVVLENEESQTSVRIIVASRTNLFASSDNVIDVGKYNYEDIGVKLQADLQEIKSLSQQEVTEAKDKIRSEAG